IAMAVSRQMGGSMELRFGWKRLVRPFRICLGLIVSDVRRPRERQRHGAEHGSLEPLVAAAGPVKRRIRARSDEFQILAVSHFVLAHREDGRLDSVLVKFVVPSETVPAPLA